MRGICFTKSVESEKEEIYLKKKLSVISSKSSQSDHIQHFAFLVLSLRRRLQKKKKKKIKQAAVSRRIYFCYEWNELRTTSDSTKLTATV